MSFTRRKSPAKATAINVACSYCGAGEGQPCHSIGKGGKPLSSGTFHDSRKRLMHDRTTNGPLTQMEANIRAGVRHWATLDLENRFGPLDEERSPGNFQCSVCGAEPGDACINPGPGLIHHPERRLNAPMSIPEFARRFVSPMAQQFPRRPILIARRTECAHCGAGDLTPCRIDDETNCRRFQLVPGADV